MHIQALPKDESSLNLKFSEAEFWCLLARNAVIDGRKGGLVKCGERGLPVMCRFRDSYFVQSKVSNGDFIMTQKAFGHRWQRVIALESRTEPPSEVVSDFVPVIEAADDSEVLFVLIELGQTVVARRSVAKHLGELIRLNREGPTRPMSVSRYAHSGAHNNFFRNDASGVSSSEKLNVSLLGSNQARYPAPFRNDAGTTCWPNLFLALLHTSAAVAFARAEL